MPKNRSKKNNNKPKTSRRRRGRKSNGYPIDRSEMTMSNTGGLIAPMATEYCRPKVYQSTKKPTRAGAEAALTGCDFVGTFASALTDQTHEFDLNALDSNVFKRLCAIASVWRRFVFIRLTFHLFGIAAATQNGFGAMASIVTDDLGGLAPISGEAEVLNMENCALVRPWSGVSHQVNCKAEGLKWYTCSPTASATTYGDAIGRAFLYIPGTGSAGDIQIQVYVSYDVEFSQRVAYQTEVPSTIDFVTSTLKRYHEEITKEISDAAADEGLADSFESAFFGYDLADEEPASGRPLIGALAQLSQYYITEMFADDLSDAVNDQQEFYHLLGTYWATLGGTVLNDAYKFVPFFEAIFLGKGTTWPATNWSDYLAKLAVPILDGLLLSGYDVSTVRGALITALNAYTPTLERLAELKEMKASREAKFRKRRSRDSKSPLPSPTVTSTKLVAPHNEPSRESDSRMELCLRGESLEDHRDDRPCTHPSAREGVQIWCTDCQSLRRKPS